MTALNTRTPIYPHTYGGFPACTECFQRTSDLATCADPRDGELALLCAACHRALCAGRPVTLPEGEALAETWERLARLYVNEEINDQLIYQALTKLAGHLVLENANAAFEQLCEALARLAILRSGHFDLMTVEPELRDQELLENLADDDAKNAIHKLTGGR